MNNDPANGPERGSDSSAGYLAAYGARLINQGYQIVPIPKGEKYPKGLGKWQSLPPATPADVAGWLRQWPDAGVGVRAQWTPMVDIDVQESRLVEHMVNWVDQNIGVGLVRVGQAPKTGLVFRAVAPFSKVVSGTYWVNGEHWTDKDGKVKKKEYKVEILGDGQQFVAFAIHPETRGPYEWLEGNDLLQTPWPQLDVLTQADAVRICAEFDRLVAGLVASGVWVKTADASAGFGNAPPGFDAAEGMGGSGEYTGSDPLDIKPPRPGFGVAEIRALLVQPRIAARARDRDMWFKAGMAISHQTGGSDEGKELWLEWSSNDEALDKFAGEHDIDKTWASFKNDKKGKALTIQYLIRWAEEDAKADAKFRWDNFVAKVGTFKETAEATEPGGATFKAAEAAGLVTEAKRIVRDNPDFEDGVAELLKVFKGAGRIDSLRKLVRAPKQVSQALARMDGEAREAGEGSFDTRDGEIVPSQTNVDKAVRMATYAHFAFDEFQSKIMVARASASKLSKGMGAGGAAGSGGSGGAGVWRPLEDNDYPRLLVALETMGFGPVPKEKIRDSVSVVAYDHKFDSALDWGNSLRWDGVSRLGTFCRDFLGVEQTPYTRALGLYMWTAMAGRLLVPGIKVDMVPLLISEEGLNKTSFVEALSPDLKFFGGLDMSKKDDDVSRQMKGKLILEWAELKGIKGRDEESIKQFFTQTHQEWVPKYKEEPVTYGRRCFIVGTTNGRDPLPAYGKARRWLPLAVSEKALVGALVASRGQLWAEGIATFKAADGILWQEVTELAPEIRDRYREEDPLAHFIRGWLDSRQDAPFVAAEIIAALAFTGIRNVKAGDCGKALRALGYDTRSVWVPELKTSASRWVKV